MGDTPCRLWGRCNLRKLDTLRRAGRLAGYGRGIEYAVLAFDGVEHLDPG